MTNEEILRKAIKKAYKGGWNGKLRRYSNIDQVWQVDGDVPGNPDTEALVFNHDFAKALWGEEEERVWLCPKCDYSFKYTWHGETGDHCPYDGRKLKDTKRVKEYGNHPWQYHLQAMVISDDPIAYLEQNLEGDE